MHFSKTYLICRLIKLLVSGCLPKIVFHFSQIPRLKDIKFITDHILVLEVCPSWTPYKEQCWQASSIDHWYPREESDPKGGEWFKGRRVTQKEESDPEGGEWFKGRRVIQREESDPEGGEWPRGKRATQREESDSKGGEWTEGGEWPKGRRVNRGRKVIQREEINMRYHIQHKLWCCWLL